MINKDFNELGLSPELVRVVFELGYKNPTSIQAQTIPLLLEGKDIIAQSRTGSGKTAAFALALLEKIQLKDRLPQALVLCPTRELCVQVAREIKRLAAKHPGLKIVALAGGQPLRDQKAALETGSHIVVGTPGRTLDHLTRGTLDLQNIRTAVLDEADRMLEMGFRDEMTEILKDLPSQRQTVFFSATYPQLIEELSFEYQKKPVRILGEEDPQMNSVIDQQSYEVTPETKFETLLRILRLHQPTSALIFCNLKNTIDETVKALEKESVSCAALHGDLEQRDRDRVMARFRNRSLQILVATDVAARGLDVKDLDMVINFDMPSKPDTYIHRIGRTGRAGQNGLAITLVSPRDERHLQDIQASLGKKIEPKILSQLKERDLRSNVLRKEAEMDTLYISGGRKDKMRPGDILGALTGEAGRLNAKDIGKIEIHDRFSYVAVSKNITQKALASLRDGRIKGHKFQIKIVK